MLTNKQRQIKRLYSRIITMLKKGNVIFLTFTFNDKTMIKTNQITRLRYVKHYLNKYACNYVLNVDYGKITQREHYHAIARPKYKEFIFDEWQQYGFLKGDIIGNAKRYKNINKSLEDIAERLTEHATKESTKNSRIIYSRRNYKYIEIDDIKESAKAPNEEETKAQKRINEDKAEETTEEEPEETPEEEEETAEETPVTPVTSAAPRSDGITL